MIKRYRWSKMGVIAAVMALSVAAMAGEHTDKKAGFAFTPPKQWKRLNVQEYENLVFFMAPNPKTGANINYIVEPLAKKMNLNTYSQSAMKGLEQMFEDYKRISYREVTIGSMKAGEHVYTATSNGMKMKGKQIWFLRGNRSYIFTFTSLANSYNQYVGDFDRSLRSVRWLK
ncbi:MAG: DcrB-related protein [Fimbriimonadia bacterium]|nr:DcrB-related protein [Fimbriimonadia bacterium]